MTPKIANVLITLFPGLNLPPTISLPLSTETTICQLYTHIQRRLPIHNSRAILTTTSNKQLSCVSSSPISSLLCPTSDLVCLRLGIPLYGGKGGFGSQLRAAGGRMSSKRKRGQGEENASSRNLDGRRLRTVNEAKALAEYLAIKPELARRQDKARRRKWEQAIELAELKEDEIKSGKNGRVDGRWAEAKEEASERTRDAVINVMKTGKYNDNLNTITISPKLDSVALRAVNLSVEESTQKETAPPERVANPPVQRFFGFDEDEEMSSEEES